MICSVCATSNPNNIFHCQNCGADFFHLEDDESDDVFDETTFTPDDEEYFGE